MNYVNGIRFLLAAFAMVLTVGAMAQEAAEQSQGPRQVDRLELDASSVTGNQELPTVMYIVPWKEADAGDFSGKPMNSLLDEVLAPLDREVFKRQVKYYDQLHASEQATEQED